MRKNIVVGNWKMNLNRAEGIALVNEILSKLPVDNITEIVFAPSFIHLYEVSGMIAHTKNISLASQDCSASEKGAFTGEVSASMITSCNARYVILGHSERRANFNESNQILKRKIKQAFVSNLSVIFCCGETLEQRESGVHFDWIKSQLTESVFHLSADNFSNILVAYEPIWAIGTGVTASSEQAQEIHSFIRELIAQQYGSDIARNTSILYGGSCNPDNARELFSQRDIDGGLIGGASLDSTSFSSITQSFQ
jgi:triosephosphate isomerase (TIM)